MTLDAGPTERDPAEVSKDLPPSFGLATSTFVVVSSMVGVGVLTTSGFTVHAVGSNLVMLTLWIVGAAIAICGALSLAELAAAIPKSGGDYVFLYEAYGPLAAFLSGWVSFLIGFGAPIAATAFAAGDYLVEPFGLSGGQETQAAKILATVLILVFAAVHSFSRAGTITVHGATTIIKLGILAALAIVGIAFGWGNWENLTAQEPVEGSFAVAALSSLVYIYYAYTGWNGAAYVAGEVDQPQRRMPQAILLGTGLVVVLYLALNLFYALALSPGDVRRIADEAGDINALTPIAELSVRQFVSPRVSGVLSIIIGLTMLASLSAMVLTGPRVAFAMARAGQFPAIAGRLSGPARTPAVATGMQVAWSIVLLWTGTFRGNVVYAGVGLAIFSTLTISAVYTLRIRQPELPRPFRTPFYPIVPALYILATIALAIATASQNWKQAGASLLSIAAGVPFYYGWRRFARRGTGNREQRDENGGATAQNAREKRG